MSVLAGLRHPVVQAPMAGGVSTVALAAAVGEAGALGFLAAGYRPAAAVAEDIAALRARTAAPFGVNVFVPSPRRADPSALSAHLEALRAEAARLGTTLGEPRHDDDGWAAKLELLARAAVPVASFAFGCPPRAAVERLRAAGTEVWVTVTTPAEAREAEAAGADVLVAQGAEAGAHRSTFDDAGAAEPLGLLALVQLLRAAAPLPVVAAGGIATGAGLAAALAAGAAAGQVGTAFLRCPEAGTAEAHRRALDLERPTRLTRAFTGRQARAIANAFAERHEATAPSAYPEVHHATAPLRAAARAGGDAEALHLWAGQAHRLGRAEPAGALVARLAGEARAALAGAAARAGEGPA